MNSEQAPESKWYVIYTFPHFEKKVHSSLCQASIPCFLPLQKVVRQWSDRKKITEEALFPNYVFVRTTNKNKYNVLGIYGVSRYVCFGGKPVNIPETEMEMIRQAATEPGLAVEQQITSGDKVSIINGVFRGRTGVVFKRKGKTRVAVRIEALNQFLSLETSLSAIRKIEQRQL